MLAKPEAAVQAVERLRSVLAAVRAVPAVLLALVPEHLLLLVVCTFLCMDQLEGLGLEMEWWLGKALVSCRSRRNTRGGKHLHAKPIDH